MTGKEVRAIREARGESQYAFSQALGVAENTVWRWENDRVNIPRPIAMLLRSLPTALSAA